VLFDSDFRKRGSRFGIFGIGKTDQGSGFLTGVQLFGTSGAENDGIRTTPPRIIPRQVQTSSSNG
jgi:hypothetical protein